MEITFTYPTYLFFLFLVPIVILFHFIGLRKKRKAALKFANFEAISRIRGIDLYSRSFISLFFYIFIILFFVFSLSGITLHKEKAVSSFSFVIAIDTSRSMEATDMIPSRMEVAKSTALDFTNKLPFGVKVGIVSFSNNALILEEVTDSKDLISRAIRSVELSSIGGTDMYDAVVTSTNLLKDEPSRAIIVLSDGQINIGNLSDAIDYATKNNAIVHTIAMGTSEGGETSFGVSTLDENSLRALSYGTDGTFFRATNEEELEKSFDDIIGLKIGKASISLGPYLIIAGLLLFIIHYIISAFDGRLFS